MTDVCNYQIDLENRQNSANGNNDVTDKNRAMEVFHITSSRDFTENAENPSAVCPLKHLPRRPAVDIEFSDLSYSVYDARIKGNKTILHNLKGKFKSGELVGIMGPSGAGKSTLMDVLAGYKTNGLTGNVLINKKRRSLRPFRKMSCYIMQAGELLPHLSILEAMTVSANLKLDRSISAKDKRLVIDEILETLGLMECIHTRCCHLSGGQKKRVSIALELVNNPPVMFLDEPTSGLDSSSCLQCITLLKALSHGGRTIICTIHQPSARLFEKFDQLYTLSNGHCIYQGPVHYLVPFLKSLGLQCPSFHNPADYMMEVATGEHGANVVSALAKKMNSTSPLFGGRARESDASFNDAVSVANGLYRPGGRSCSTSTPPLTPTDILIQSNDSLTPTVPEMTPSTPFQFYILLKRTLLSTSRDQTLTQLRIVSHVCVGLLIGMLYFRIGEDASNVTNNSGCIFFTILFLMFSSMMPTILTFPTEMTVLIREHLNHWYTLKSFYLAKTSADVPFQVVFTVVYVCIVYWMTNQPEDITRFSMFLLVSILTSLVAQSVGLLVGAAMTVENGTYFGPVSAIPCVLFSGFFVTLNAIPSYLKWVSYISYIRFGFEGCMLAVYGFNRSRLKCSEAYCHFRNPAKFLEELNMVDTVYWVDVGVLAVFFVILRLATYLVLKWKIQSWT